MFRAAIISKYNIFNSSQGQKTEKVRGISSTDSCTGTFVRESHPPHHAILNLADTNVSA